jgi:hypothetical protein
VEIPDVRYVRSGDVSIAYQVVGEGSIDIVFVRGFAGNGGPRAQGRPGRMAPVRRDPGVRYWLLVRGQGDRPLGRHVDAARITTQRSTKHPSVRAGDRAILYASVWQAIFGVVDVVGDPEQDPSRSRWSWGYPIRPVTLVADLNDAPPVEAAGVFPQSLWRHSHIRLTNEQFESARELIEATTK